MRSFFPLNIIFDYFFVIAFRFFSISEACPPSRALALVRQCHNNIPIIIAFFFLILCYSHLTFFGRH